MNDLEDQVRDFIDRSLRELLAHPENLHEFMGSAAPQLVGGFDFANMRPARREFLLTNWRTREADLVFEIPYRLPDRVDLALVCVMLEHQTKAEWRTPLITLIYAALYWEWQLRQWEQQKPPRSDFLLRPILPIVLYTGSGDWNTVKTLRDMLVEPEVFRPLLPDWQPIFWELSKHSPAELLNSHSAFLQVLTLLRIEKQDRVEAEAAFLTVLQQVGSLHDTNHLRWEELVRFILGWAQHRRPVQERSHWQTIAEQFQTTERRKQEIKNMGMTIAQGIFLEGKAEGALEMLLHVGRKKLGDPNGATLESFQAIDDVNRIGHMIDAVAEAASWAEVLEVK